MKNLLKSAGTGNRNKRDTFFSFLVLLLLLVYCGVFIYLNMAKYGQHVDSDIAAEALLAREIWNEKSLTPDDWIGSTERLVVGMPTLAAVFYGMTGSMQTAVGIACVIIGAALTGVLFFFLRWLGISRLSSLTAILIIYALPINGLRNDGQMVPFIMLLLFLFADYYALHSILLLLTIVFYLHLKENGGGVREGCICLFLFLFTTAVSLGGQRCLQVVVLPMAAVEMVSLFCESKQFSHALGRKRFAATAFTGALLLAFGVSCLYRGQADYVMYLLKPQEIIQRLFVTVPAAVLEGFGIAGLSRLGGFPSLMQLLVWAFLVLLAYGLVFIFRRKNQVPERQKTAILILLSSLGVTAAAVALTTAEPAHNYFFMEWFAALTVTAVLADRLRLRGSRLAEVIVLCVCIFAVLNLKFTYADAVLTEDNLAEYEEVIGVLEEEGVTFGYAEFWDAGRICLMTDGAITMGHSYRMSELGMYWWLTSRDWYPPNLPEKMRTAYVVRRDGREAFEAQFTAPGDVWLRFENDVFAVYLSDTNYVKMP